MKSPSRPPPARLGPYEVRGRLGGGGMAAVHLGYAPDEEVVSRRFVALKILNDDLGSDEQYIDMFRDEAGILSRMTHPNIVATLGYGVEGDHRYIAMELLLGRAVADVCDELERRAKHMPADLAAWICSRVAGALSYAHELRDADGTPLEVVHRDVNPPNIFLTYDGRVKLIDFGLAKAVRRKARSRDGIVKGKISYLSPEQVKAGAVDRGTDLYSLGATLWEMTTGRRLWKRATDLETIEAIRSGIIPDPTVLVPGYPEDLWAIAWEALLPKRADRYGDAQAMAKDLDAFLERTVGGVDMEARARTCIEDAFPGERARREAWLDRERLRS